MTGTTGPAPDTSDETRDRSSETFTMYSTPWCGYCHRLRGQLDREGVSYTVVDIEEQPEAAAYVREVNDGFETVPTVVFPDGSALTNPSLAQVLARVAS